MSKNERNAGRKPEGKEAKAHKSIRVEPWKIEIISNDFVTFNKGVQTLIDEYIKRNNYEADKLIKTPELK